MPVGVCDSKKESCIVQELYANANCNAAHRPDLEEATQLNLLSLSLHQLN